MTNENKTGSFPIRLSVTGCEGEALRLFNKFNNMAINAAAKSSDLSKLTGDTVEAVARFYSKIEADRFYDRIEEFSKTDGNNRDSETYKCEFILIRG